MSTRRGELKAPLLLFIAFLMSIAWTVHPVSAHANSTSNQTVVQKEIMLNAVVVSNPSTLVYQGTTYMPILNIVDLLRRLGIRSDWTGQTLFLSTKATFPDALPHLSQGVAGGIYVDGSRIVQASGRNFYDPKLQDWTTALPLPQMIHVLKVMGLWNTWNGAIWSVLTHYGHPPSVTMHNVSDIFTPSAGPTSNGREPTSAAKPLNDESYWKRADSRFYIGVESDKGREVVRLEPNQPLSVYAYLENENLNSITRWFVNSPDATIRSESGQFTVHGFRDAQAVFVAKKPGIYTIQAKCTSLYSIPMVIVAGFNELPHHPMHLNAAETGIQLLPQSLPSVRPMTVTDFTYNPYAAQNGWLPVQGIAKSGTGSVVVDLSLVGNDNLFTEYQLPARQNGNFSGMVRIPFTGRINVRFFPDMFRDMDTTRTVSGGSTPVAQYTVENTVPTTEQQRSLFATDFLDYNMNAALVQTAETLYENSPSKAAAIEAISNFAGEKLLYDWPEYIDEKYNVQLFNANGTWNLQTGTFRDINHLTAAMLRSVGIPTEICWGNLDPSISTQYYTWLDSSLGSEQAMLGRHDLEFDPSMAAWSSVDGYQGCGNEYFGSGKLLDTHHSLNGKRYTFYEGIY